jgi:hypothetical protein
MKVKAASTSENSDKLLQDHTAQNPKDCNLCNVEFRKLRF